MHPFLTQIWQRFKSAVPPIIKKTQIILGLAAGSFTACAAITWPGKLAAIGIIAGYAAAVCAGIVLALQFITQTVTVLETKTEVKITTTQTTDASQAPVSNNEYSS